MAAGLFWLPGLRSRCLLVMVLLASVGNCYGWSDSGHRMTCELAEAYLQPQVKQQVQRLLAAVPEAEARRTGARGTLKLAEACTWADRIRDINRYKPLARWHYINMSRSDSRANLAECVTGCVVVAIDVHLAIVADRHADVSERAVALMLLGHWLGDLHQPLHVSFGDDRGGNQTRVSGYDGCTNLHRVWDYCVLAEAASTPRELQQKLRAAVSADDVRQWQAGSLLQWANESYDIVRRASFQYCEMRSGSCRAIASQPYRLAENYQANAQAIALQQVRKGGVRLAGLLNQALAQ